MSGCAKVPAKDPNRPVLIVGAGEAGAWAINVCKSNKEYGHAVVAVDDDPAKLNQTIHGVPVKGTLEDIPELCTRYGIYSIIIAIPTLKGSKLSHVIDCASAPTARCSCSVTRSWWAAAHPSRRCSAS